MDIYPQLRSNFCKHRLAILKVEEMPKAHGRRLTYRCVKCKAVLRDFKRNTLEKGAT